MGAYLNKPITEKETEASGNAKIRYAATTMQGWRVNQEDAHNCILDFCKDWHLFAVYDGHGGAEVAKYTAEHFPDFLKERDLPQVANIVKVLEDSFVEFDDELRSAAVMKELKKLAAAEANGNEKSDDDSDVEDRGRLLEEGTAPLEELLARYGYTIITHGARKTVKHVFEDIAVTTTTNEAEEDSGECGPSGGDKKHKRPNESPRQERVKRAKSERCEDGDGKEESGDAGAEKRKDEEELVKKENADVKNKKTAKAEKAETTDEEKNNAVDAHTQHMVNGQASDDHPDVINFKGKGSKAVPVNAKPMSLPEGADVSSSDDDDYHEGMDEEDEDEEEEEEEEEGDGVEPDEDTGEMEEDEFGGLSGASFGPGACDTPGEDSGTTACVCIVTPGKVIVANAGDSRAVLSRGGHAVELSVDHKPEDEPEKARITRAGGCVNEDGRVNGGLNLSRALGDHCYKKNKKLELREQMISALPDVRVEDTKDEDEFIVVACDGIWNSLESQQVVDFVKERLDKGLHLKEICEQMCTACLADSTAGDGTGCDNMTVIIADLKPHTRIAPPTEEQQGVDKTSEENSAKKADSAASSK